MGEERKKRQIVTELGWIDSSAFQSTFLAQGSLEVGDLSWPNSSLQQLRGRRSRFKDQGYKVMQFETLAVSMHLKYEAEL